MATDDAQREPVLNAAATAAFVAPPTSPPVPFTDDHLLDADVPCISCSYNLRGLSELGVCPECGTRVAPSLGGRRLRSASTAYLHSIASGLTWLIGAVIACALLALFVLVFSRALAPVIGMGSIALLWFAASLALAWGYWRLTYPDPQGEFQGHSVGSRRFTRYTLFVWLILQGVLVYRSLAWGGRAPSFLPAIGIGGLSLQGAVGVAFFFGTMSMLSNLARRVPSVPLIRRVETYVWVLPVLSTVGMLVCFTGPVIALVLFILLLVDIRRNVLAALSWQAAAAYAHPTGQLTSQSTGSSTPPSAGNRASM